MSLHAELASVATEAQGILADIGGMPAGKTNGLFNGKKTVGVYGNPQTFFIPRVAGGYSRRAVVSYSATRDQFTEAPKAKQSFTRTDLGANIVYLIDDVNLHDPFFYTLTLVKNGD